MGNGDLVMEEDHTSHITDENLMRALQSGDQNAFNVVFDRYASRLINFAYRFLYSRQESEDIAQEVLMRVYKGKEGYDSSRPFPPWVFSIASRLVSNRLRHKKRHPQESLDFTKEETEGEPQNSNIPDASSPPPEQILEKQRLIALVQEALAQLPENQRTAVILARFEEMSYEEIAQTMEISVSAVKSLLFRARESLKISLSSAAQETDPAIKKQ